METTIVSVYLLCEAVVLFLMCVIGARKSGTDKED